MANVKFVNVNKIYDNNVQAVFDFNLEVQDKEFIVLVGPSGCGKSTTLRMLAGLEEISEGQILIDNVVVNDIHPKNRDIAMVFQNYALYPHMTVYNNMAFALKMKGLPKNEIEQRVNEAAKILALEEYLYRKPKALSGGQRQRVALGRAIVRTPKVFLMDEPLSNLDAKLRVQMRSEIIKIHKKVNATTIYVTHDQTEAMTMADRIVIMKGGYIQQIGTPKEVYNEPNNTFVGGFIGSPAMNFFTCRFQDNSLYIKSDDDSLINIPLNKKQLELIEKYQEKKIEDLKMIIQQIDDQKVEIEGMGFVDSGEDVVLETNTSPSKKKKKVKKYSKEELMQSHLTKLRNLRKHYEEEIKDFENKQFDLILGIRPEDILIDKKAKKGTNELAVDLSELLGHERIIYSYLGNQRIIIKVQSDEEFESGETFSYKFNEDKIHFFDVDTTNRIKGE